MKYDFHEIIDRSENNSLKYDELDSMFGRKDLYSLWVADMDFKVAPAIQKALEDKVKEGIYGYTSRPDSYYGSMVNWYNRRYNWNIDKDLVLHSPSVVSSLSLMVQEFTKPGDKIIIQPPVYYPFSNVVKNHGRKLVLNPLKEVDGKYYMDYEDLEEKIDENTKLLILCNPHNPVGRVWTKEELEKLGNICIKKGVKIVSDEIHGDLTLWGRRYTPLGSISEEFRKNTITCLSTSKTFNLAGVQASFIVVPDKEDFEKLDRVMGLYDVSRNNCFSLVAVEAALTHGEEWLEELLVYLGENIEFLIDYCKNHMPKIVPNKPEGTYLVWLDCSNLNMTTKELDDFMINKAKVALDSGFWFGREGKKYMRINVACSRELIKMALDSMKRAYDQL
ncbi:MalY/PatB family protein [Anaeromicrobium sediminis]|uniref:cysteine-S-conjugate beta-lyase n=1 Tax=Anaeromicrobium sediminis TaxID=1478221 RepID=A0A267MNT5_9FIRM|nr:MalY/PatB family protein [Anaeromicrobium sediminis]PAB60578.1 cystathionine beta-lyase [Anaeromicrobium sediminis]